MVLVKTMASLQAASLTGCTNVSKKVTVGIPICTHTHTLHTPPPPLYFHLPTHVCVPKCMHKPQPASDDAAVAA